jgi:hypothetical protein
VSQKLPGKQSRSVAHGLAHLSPVHTNGAQSVPTASNTQLPNPSQTFPFIELPAHCVVPHAVALAYKRHDPKPLQLPSRWHSADPSSGHSSSGSTPFFTGSHSPSTPIPFFATLQDWHRPVHAVAQHTPSTQYPL